MSSLKQVLKRYPKEDSINGRVYRIIGNLCQHKSQWANFILDKKPQVVIHIVKFLKDVATSDTECSEATVIMGIRALRELLNKESLKVLVKNQGVLKVIGMLLIKYGGLWETNQTHKNILLNIIKLLLEYSKYRYYPSIMEVFLTFQFYNKLDVFFFN